MKHTRFSRLVEERLNSCKDVLISKDKEYSSEGDRLHNFKRAAALDEESPEKALWGMMKKHIISMRDMVEKIDENEPCYIPSKELVHEKLGDVINYTLLLEGLIEERRDKESDLEQPSE